jgi:hypothetical protein
MASRLRPRIGRLKYADTLGRERRSVAASGSVGHCFGAMRWPHADRSVRAT